MWLGAIPDQDVGALFKAYLYVDSGSQLIAAYSLDIIYNPSLIQVETAVGHSGVEIGADGFVSAVDAGSPGVLIIAGFDVAGHGPGTQLHLLTITWRALADGISPLTLTVDSLVDTSYLPIGTPRGITGSVTVGTGILNTPPEAGFDSYSVMENDLLTVSAPGVLTNDSDPDGDELQAVLIAGVIHGILTLNADGSFSYTPNAGYSGPDSFTYVADDLKEESNFATVTITVVPIDDNGIALFSNVIRILPIAILIGVLIVHQRRKKPRLPT